MRKQQSGLVSLEYQVTQPNSSGVSSSTPLFPNTGRREIAAPHGGVIGTSAAFSSLPFWHLFNTVPGTVASYGYSSARSDQAKADRNLRLLNVSASVVLAFQVVTIIVSMLAAYKVKEINRIRCFELAALALLVMPVPIYRLCVLQIRTINVFEPLSPSSRAIFYIVHLVPEWLCASVLLGTNVRARFCTGRWGDYELRESLRDKRLEKAAENGISLEEVDGSKAV
ncbi:hypothetical protein RSAG8_03691, partial [Rhizoctonia solani AG-8 WAC10335]